MLISGLQKLTLLDYPSKMACIIFTGGCNYKCQFCQNSLLIKNKQENLIDENEILDFLKRRKKLLDGVVISGGEPTIHSDLKNFIIKVKFLGYDIKLDTNGTNPNLLKDLIDSKLIDYVAMDIKNVFNKYENIIGIKPDVDKIKKSIEILKNSNIDYEFRTTIVKEFHDINDILKLCELVGNDSKYYLQNFRDNENVLKKGLHGFSEEEQTYIQNKIKKGYPNAKVRGLKEVNYV